MASILSTTYFACLAVLALFGAHRVWLVIHAWRQRRIEPARMTCLDHPFVTVQLPLFNETAVAARVIDAVCAFAWPRERLEIQVLDDSTDETVAIVAARVAMWRERGIDIAHVRRASRQGWKAGALEAARATARGEFIAVFDADFVPAADFLATAVPHFASSNVGLVQCRWEHLNRSGSWLTEVQALLLDGHFAIEQRARAHRDLAFNFNGTAGVWRAAAIADAGGWHADTLTEDLDLSYRAALKNWRFILLTRANVPAELPADVRGFRAQQFRWAKGSIEVARKLWRPITTSHWSLVHRAEARAHLLHNAPYLATATLIAISPVTFAFAAPPKWFSMATLAVTIVILTSYVAVSQRILRHSVVRALLRVPALLVVTIGIALGQARAVLEAAFGRRSEFVRTPKLGDAKAVKHAPTPSFPVAHWLMCAWLASGGVFALLRGDIFATLQLALFCGSVGWVAVAETRSGSRRRLARIDLVRQKLESLTTGS